MGASRHLDSHEVGILVALVIAAADRDASALVIKRLAVQLEKLDQQHAEVGAAVVVRGARVVLEEAHDHQQHGVRAKPASVPDPGAV